MHTGKNHDQYTQSVYSSVLLPQAVTLHSVKIQPGRVALSVGHLTRKSGVLGSIPSLATYFGFSFRFFKKGSCQLLAKVCARSTSKPPRRSKPAQEKVWLG